VLGRKRERKKGVDAHKGRKKGEKGVLRKKAKT